MGHKMFLVPLEQLELVPAIRAACPPARICPRGTDKSNARRRRPRQALGRHHLHDRLEARPDLIEDTVGLWLFVEESRGELEPLGAVEQACAGVAGVGARMDSEELRHRVV